MSRIMMYPGETLLIGFADSDGEFAIHFDNASYPKQLVVRESDGLSGNVKGGANEILYHEDFGASADDDSEVETVPMRVGFFMDASGKVQCTALVSCFIRETADGFTVITLSEANGEESEETGEFTFYESVDALDDALISGGSIPFTRIAI